MLKHIYYAETEGPDLIISVAEDQSIRHIGDELLDAINDELPEWIDIYDLDCSGRARIVFTFLRNSGDDDHWNDDGLFTIDELLHGTKIIAEADIEL